MSARPLAKGPIRLGGVRALDLTLQYGTPLLVIDTDELTRTVQTIVRAATAHDVEVAYAGKAFLCVQLVKLFEPLGLGLDVCSLGELLTAERAGFPARRMTLHGCGKSGAELGAVVAGRVGRVVVDNAEELEALATLATSAGATVPVILRVNSGIAASTHDLVRTAGNDTKFGFSADEAAATASATHGRANLQVVGLHAHLGSQIFSAATFCAHAEAAMQIYARFHRLGAAPRALILGGGFGVADRAPQADADVAGLLLALLTTVARESRAAGLPQPRLGIEPGRALIARAGTSLYRVSAVKQRGARRFAIVDGGLYENPRPAMYGAYHHPILVSRAGGAGGVETTVCGRSCENDELATALLPADLVAGDVLALRNTGAYTFSMASNYNRFARPAVVFAGGGSTRLAVRRETEEDVLRHDVLELAP